MARKKKEEPTTRIPRSRRAFWYHLGYYFWRAFKKLIFWVVFFTVALTAIDLIRKSKAFGISDSEMAKAFLEPFREVLPIFVGIILVYAIIRAIIATFNTFYDLTPSGILVRTGWWTKRTVIVSYDQIQKMTIVANPFDRVLKSTYIYLDLIGGGLGISLEAVDAKAVTDLQQKLTTVTVPRLTTAPNADTTPAKLPAKTKDSKTTKLPTKAKTTKPTQKPKAKPDPTKAKAKATKTYPKKKTPAKPKSSSRAKSKK